MELHYLSLANKSPDYFVTFPWASQVMNATKDIKQKEVMNL